MSNVSVSMRCVFKGVVYKGFGRAPTSEEARKQAAVELRNVLPTECVKPDILVYENDKPSGTQHGLWPE